MAAIMQAASKALKEREAALLTLHAIEADLDKRRHAVAALDGEGQKVTTPLESAAAISTVEKQSLCFFGDHSRSLQIEPEAARCYQYRPLWSSVLSK